MNDDVAKLILEKLDNLEGRFGDFEGKFDNLEREFNKLEGQVGNLTTEVGYIKSNMATQDDIAKVHEEMATKEDTNHILNILDKHTDMLDTDELERLALSKQVDRLQDWAERSASKIGVPIKHQG